MNFTKNDFYILDTTSCLKATNALGSVTVSDLVGATKLSHTKIRSSLKALMAEGYIAEGFKDFNAKTYYITQTGQDKVSEINSTLKERADVKDTKIESEENK